MYTSKLCAEISLDYNIHRYNEKKLNNFFLYLSEAKSIINHWEPFLCDSTRIQKQQQCIKLYFKEKEKR